MPTGTPAEPTPIQVAKFGHSTATIREALKRRGWEVGDLNVAMGRPRGHAGAYHWVNGKGCPAPPNAASIAKLLGVNMADLAPREVKATKLVPATTKPKRPSERIEEESAMVRVRQEPPPVAVVKTGDVLSFSVDRNGMARLRLDAVLPVGEAAPLLRMLLDAGVVMGGGDGD